MFHPAYSFADTQQRDIYQFEQRLVQLVESSDYFSMRTLGIVRYDTVSSPIWLVTFKGDAVKKKKVFISGNIIHKNKLRGQNEKEMGNDSFGLCHSFLLQ